MSLTLSGPIVGWAPWFQRQSVVCRMFIEGPWAQCLWKGARRKLNWAKGEVELPCRPDSLNSTGSSGVRMTQQSCPDRPKWPILYPHLHESLNAGSLWRGTPLGRLLSAAQDVLRGLKTDSCSPPSSWDKSFHNRGSGLCISA